MYPVRDWKVGAVEENFDTPLPFLDGRVTKANVCAGRKEEKKERKDLLMQMWSAFPLREEEEEEEEKDGTLYIKHVGKIPGRSIHIIYLSKAEVSTVLVNRRKEDRLIWRRRWWNTDDVASYYYYEMGVVVVVAGNGRRESEEDIIPQSVGRPFCEPVLSSFISKGASAIVHSASASIQQPVRWLSHIKVQRHETS